MRPADWRGALLSLLASLRARGSVAAGPPRCLHDFVVRDASGADMPLARYRGVVVLVVNTASRCGFTPQYRGLETLRLRYRERGFEVLAFPANDFMGQEPGSDAEIQAFCGERYGVTFPVFAKLVVRGRECHPLYAWLTRESPFPGAIPWNFTKFLVGRDGRVIARFGPPTDPLDPALAEHIEAALDAP